MTTSSDRQTLEAYLAGRRNAVEAALDAFMPAEDLPPERLHRAMRYSVFSGGKRLRPILVLASFELLRGSGDAVLTPACAAEMIHTYSLIHDDLPAMDDDELRRGRPTCHRAFDEPTAILAGDALLTLAFGIVAQERRLSADARTSIIGELAAANGHAGMVGGQVADLMGESSRPTRESVRFIHVHKTGMPLEAAVVIGGLAAGADPSQLTALRTYGGSIGLAFQIVDDLLDVLGSEEQMGKAVGKDASRGKQTYPSVAGIEGSKQRARELLDEALEGLSAFGDEAWPLRAIARFIVERSN
jgi:geranylgeranyl diphosphate synthase type II